jgi:uncharacterized lipoprotein YmbA
MNPVLSRYTLGLALIFLLAGCGTSPPNEYYRLTAISGATATGQQPSLGVGPVTVADYLKRKGMVYSDDDNRLQITSEHRWAEPLDRGVERVLSLNLAQLMNTDNLRFFPWMQAEAPDYAIKVSVLELEVVQGEALLVADWRVYQPASGTEIRHHLSRLTRALPAGKAIPPEIAPAYSDLLYQLSELIAAAIRDAEAAAGPQSEQPI